MKNLLSCCFVVLLTSCAFERGPSLPTSSALESQQEALRSLAPGMDEQQVQSKLGRSYEVRFAKTSHLEGEGYRWAYGAQTVGGFASIGIVIFSTNKTVLETHCPTKPKFCRAQALGVPVDASPKRTTAGMYCFIDSIAKADLGPEEAPEEVRVSLATVLHYSVVNEGTNAFLQKQPTAWVKFNLVVEVFDSRMHLILRQDYSRYASAYSFDEKRWPVLEVLSGNRVGEEFPIWLTDVFYGKPAPGKYFVRLLFPFEPDHFYTSNLKEFSFP